MWWAGELLDRVVRVMSCMAHSLTMRKCPFVHILYWCVCVLPSRFAKNVVMEALEHIDARDFSKMIERSSLSLLQDCVGSVRLLKVAGEASETVLLYGNAEGEEGGELTCGKALMQICDRIFRGGSSNNNAYDTDDCFKLCIAVEEGGDVFVPLLGRVGIDHTGVVGFLALRSTALKKRATSRFILNKEVISSVREAVSCAVAVFEGIQVNSGVIRGQIEKGEMMEKAAKIKIIDVVDTLCECIDVASSATLAMAVGMEEQGGVVKGEYFLECFREAVEGALPNALGCAAIALEFTGSKEAATVVGGGQTQVIELNSGANLLIRGQKGQKTAGATLKILVLLMNVAMNLPVAKICEMNLCTYEKLMETQRKIAGVEETREKEEMSWCHDKERFGIASKVWNLGKVLKGLDGAEKELRAKVHDAVRASVGLEISWVGEESAEEVVKEGRYDDGKHEGQRCSILVGGRENVGFVVDKTGEGKAGYDIVAEVASIVADKLGASKAERNLEGMIEELEDVVRVYEAMEVCASGVKGRKGMLDALKVIYPDVYDCAAVDENNAKDGVVVGWPVSDVRWRFGFPEASKAPCDKMVKIIDGICGEGIQNHEMSQHLILTLANTPLDPFKLTLISIVKQACGANLRWVDGSRVWGKDDYGKRVVVEVENEWEKILGEDGEAVGYVDKPGICGVLGLVWQLVKSKGRKRAELGESAGDDSGTDRGKYSNNVFDLLLGCGSMEPSVLAALGKTIGDAVMNAYPSQSVDVILEGQIEGEWVVYKSNSSEKFDKVKGGFVGDVAECVENVEIVDGDAAICYPIVSGDARMCVGCLRVCKVDYGELSLVGKIVQEVGRGWGIFKEWDRVASELEEMERAKTAVSRDLECVEAERDELRGGLQRSQGERNEAEQRLKRVETKFNSLRKSFKRIEVEKDILKKENEVMEKFVYSGGGNYRGGGGGQWSESPAFLLERSAVGAGIGDLGGSRTPVSSIRKPRISSRGILRRGDGTGGSRASGVSFNDDVGFKEDGSGTEGTEDHDVHDEQNWESKALPRNSESYSYSTEMDSVKDSTKLVAEMRADNVLLSRALRDFLEESTLENGGSDDQDSPDIAMETSAESDMNLSLFAGDFMDGIE